MSQELTIDDHCLLHEVLVHEAADLAAVGAAQLCGGLQDLQGPVLPPFVTAVDLVGLEFNNRIA